VGYYLSRIASGVVQRQCSELSAKYKYDFIQDFVQCRQQGSRNPLAFGGHRRFGFIFENDHAAGSFVVPGKCE
jgi:hypothetical protein